MTQKVERQKQLKEERERERGYAAFAR